MLIQRLRDGSEGILGKVLIGVVLVIFALFGFGSFSSFNSSEIKVASVNGVEISQREIEYELERTRRVMLSRGLNLSDIEICCTLLLAFFHSTLLKGGRARGSSLQKKEKREKLAAH